jgi:Transglycosylase SLT domain
MNKPLQTALMTILTAISFLSTLFGTTPLCAQSGGITASTDESGRRIFVNGEDSTASPSAARSIRSRTPLLYWSVTDHRFKPVPTSGAVMHAARTAASEVNTYLDAKAQTHQALNRTFTQQDIDAAINQAAAHHHVDPSLVRSVVKVESNFNPNAVSRAGAMGLMQLMPSTARSLKVSNPFDPQQNVDAGVRHLRKLLDNYGGDIRLSLAAYNAGSGAVARSAGVPNFRETQNYVRRITDLYNGGSEHAVGTRLNVAVHDPVFVRRDARGVLHMSNTE